MPKPVAYSYTSANHSSHMLIISLLSLFGADNNDIGLNPLLFSIRGQRTTDITRVSTCCCLFKILLPSVCSCCRYASHHLPVSAQFFIRFFNSSTHYCIRPFNTNLVQTPKIFLFANKLSFLHPTFLLIEIPGLEKETCPKAIKHKIPF